MKLTPLTKISFFNIFINNLPARPGISNDYTHLTNFTNTSNPGINSLPKQTHMTTGNGECYTVIMHIRYQGNNHETMPVIQKKSQQKHTWTFQSTYQSYPPAHLCFSSFNKAF